MKKSTIFFDLDGTLVNTEEGVGKSLWYLMEKYGLDKPDRDSIRRFIGPLVPDALRKEYGFSEEEARKADFVFREYYETTGLFECELFPGVEKCLKALKEKGYRLIVTSSKEQLPCRQILERLGVAQYFDMIVGARLKENIGTKVEVLRDAMKSLGISNKEEVVLIACIGVSYGFEEDFGQMRQAGVTEIFDTLEEVVDYLERSAKDEH